jgi:type I restriction enzyme S subunit
MILAHTFPVTQVQAPMAINQDLKALVPREDIDECYLPWLLRGTSPVTLGRVDEAGHGTKVLRLGAWLSLVLPVPPRAEQEAITASLVRQTRELDRLATEVGHAISILEERRAALISAAVTGQIDVRNLASAEAA